MTAPWLSEATIDLVHASATTLSLTPSVLVQGIPISLVSSMQGGQAPASELLSDLHFLNGRESSAPLRTWLKNAERLSASRTEQAHFTRAIAELATRTAPDAVSAVLDQLLVQRQLDEDGLVLVTVSLANPAQAPFSVALTVTPSGLIDAPPRLPFAPGALQQAVRARVLDIAAPSRATLRATLGAQERVAEVEILPRRPRFQERFSLPIDPPETIEGAPGRPLDRDALAQLLRVERASIHTDDSDEILCLQLTLTNVHTAQVALSIEPGLFSVYDDDDQPATLIYFDAPGLGSSLSVGESRQLELMFSAAQERWLRKGSGRHLHIVIEGLLPLQRAVWHLPLPDVD